MVWVFGYGSLIWKVDFEYEEKYWCYIKGFHRRFWQGSHDHRGTPSAPGRVVTLVSNDYLIKTLDSNKNDDLVWGVCFKIPSDKDQSILNYLNYREKNGFSLHSVQTFLEDDSPFEKALVYIANEENEAFLGYSSNDEIARHILHSKGPSGTNFEYFIELYRILKQHNRSDPHLEDIYQNLMKIQSNL